MLELAETTSRAVDMVLSVLCCHALPHVLHICAAQVLLDLTRPDAYFTESEVGKCLFLACPCLLRTTCFHGWGTVQLMSTVSRSRTGNGLYFIG